MSDMDRSSTMEDNEWVTDSDSDSENIRDSTNEIRCKCQKSAILLTVKKEGSTKGRQFYNCAKSRCNFFIWADTETINENNSQSASTSASTAITFCYCKKEAPIRTVKKEGINKGRKFYGCLNGMNRKGCRFFQWIDQNFELEKDTGRGSAPVAYVKGTKRKCDICNIEGHFRSKCPRIA